MNFLVRYVKNWDSHYRLFVGAAAALIAVIICRGRLSFPVTLVVSWDAFSACVLATVWVRIVTAHPREAYKTAKLQDSSRTTIFFFVVTGAIASVFAVGHLMGTAHGRHGHLLGETLVLAFATLIGSWSLIHTSFALRYAHLFYGDADGNSQTRVHRGGLEFPGEKAPDYLDFAYFSFVIGMTCQVSDVEVSGRPLRRLALVHGWLAFIFNTVILAISINIASGLFS
jgi:uncharacterized membrane protein